MLKQYAVAINVGFILLIALFSAKITNVYLGKMLEVKKSIGILKQAETASSVITSHVREDYDVIISRNIFDSTDTGQAVAEGGTSEDVVYTSGAEAVKTSLPIKVLAVLVIGEGKDKRSSATIDSGGGGGVDVYAVNDEKSFSSGVRLVQVKPDRIEFVRNGRLEYAELIDTMGESIFGPPKPLEGAVASKSTGDTKQQSGDTIAKVTDNKYTIDQKELDNAIANLDKLFTEIRAVPNFQDGKPMGMKILSVKPGSVFAKLGLKRGDVLQKINGMDMDVRSGFAIFNQLKDQKNLTLDLIRGGANQTVEYEIR